MKGKFWRFLKTVSQPIVHHAFFIGFFLHNALTYYSRGNQLFALTSALLVLLSFARIWHFAMHHTIVKVKTSTVERMLEEVVEE